MKRSNRRSKATAMILSQRRALARPPAEPPQKNPAVQYLASLGSASSRRTMRGVLDRAACIFDALDRGAELSTADALTYSWGAPGGLTFAKVQAAVSTFAAKGAPIARLAASALKQVARFAFNLGQLDSTERMRIDDVRPPKLSGKAKGRRLTDREVERLYAACAADESQLGRRDAALLAIALGGGARRFELSGLDLGDYARPSRLGRDPVEIVVRAGKGKKYGKLVAPPDVAEAIEAWIDARGREAGPLFYSSPGRGRDLVAGRRLSAAGVYVALGRRAEAAGIEPKIAPHDLRRTAITRFLERTGDLALGKTFARHSSPTTTARYDHREEDALRRAVAKARTGYGE